MGNKQKKMEKAIKRLKKKKHKAQQKIDAPAAPKIGAGRRKSTKDDYNRSEGSGMVEGTGGLTPKERYAARLADYAKYRRLTEDGTYTKRNRAKAKIEELEAKMKKNKKK